MRSSVQVGSFLVCFFPPNDAVELYSCTHNHSITSCLDIFERIGEILPMTTKS